MKKSIEAVLVFLMVLFLAAGAFAEDYEAGDSWAHILLIGADTRQDLPEDGRADTIIIASINKESGAVRLTSLARDMLIDLPGERGHNRINTAFRFGGAELMLQAVCETSSLDVSRYAAINFYGFCDVIDALGGVEVELTKAEVSRINRTVREQYGDGEIKPIKNAGMNMLSGVQALAYARIRKLDNDHGRTQRQRAVLISVLKRLKKLSIKEQIGFVRACFEHISTNLSLAEIVFLGLIVMQSGLDDIRQTGLPSQGNFTYKTHRGMSTIDFDMDVLRQEIHDFIYGE